MTLDELRVLIEDIIVKSDNLVEKSNNLRGFMQVLRRNVSPNNPFIDQLFTNQQDIDNFVNIQAPLYVQRLTDIEVAADALATDPFNP